MSNEVYNSGLTDLRTSEFLSTAVLQKLADRNALGNHEAIVYAGDIYQKGSNVIRVSHVGLRGAQLLVSTAENVDAANQQLLTGHTDVTVSAYTKSYEIGDLAFLTDPGNLLSVDTFAEDAVMSRANTLTSSIANIAGGFTATVGESGVAFGVRDFYDAIAILEAANVEGPYIWLAHTTTFNQFVQDFRLNVGGNVPFDPQFLGLSAARGTGYRGRLDNVDIFVSNRVPEANGGVDYAGAMWGRGAVIWADSTVQARDPINQLNIGGKVLLERVRAGKGRRDAYVTSAYLGSSMGIDECGVTTISKVA